MTADQSRTSWVQVPDGSDFPIQNLPYGVFADASGVRCGVAIGDAVFDLARAESAGLFTNTGLDRDTFRCESLNDFLGHSRGVWSSVRNHIADILDRSNPGGRSFCEKHHLIIDHPVQMRIPIEVGDYVDFYSSEQHATNVGKLFRPDGDSLFPNWKHLPVGYHGRAGTVVVSGTPINRPSGQRRSPQGPVFGPSRKLDMELEVGFVTGGGPGFGIAIPIDEAEHHIFGLCLVNDWSARDIQAWEYVPLGPFLGKSFATTISPWIVPLEALEPFRVPAGDQEPAPLPYLTTDHRIGVDIDLSVSITPNGSSEEREVTATSFTNMYWTMAQQLAHATVNGATVRPGDLFASGTVSGPTRDEFGSLLEITWNGTDPIEYPDGSTRTFLEDGDTVTIRGRCTAEDAVPIGFGECLGTIEA
ncbi:MAG: fumarylacetoacetase [Actinobacteria bacterium]|nr:MAG: fumarylacetoacetase [Actinomycetota bacterium]